MKHYDDYHQQVPATRPHDGFLFEPVSRGDRARERLQRETPASRDGFHVTPGFTQPFKDVK